MKHQRPRPGPREPAATAAASPETLIWGLHAVEAALANPARQLNKLYLTDNAANRMAAHLQQRAIQPERTTPRDLDRRLGPDTVHQGALLETEPLPEPQLIELALTTVERGPIIALDQVTDPHNVGAILRSAAVFGAAGLVLTRRHSPPLSGALAKAASGALELVPVALVQNLARALAELRDAGIDVIGLDGDAETRLETQSFSRPVAIVLGAEGRGLRQLTKETCSSLCRITGSGPLRSLNVSNAAAVSLHHAALSRMGLPATTDRQAAG